MILADSSAWIEYDRATVGCAVDVVFDNEADSKRRVSRTGTPFANVEGITRWRWPADPSRNRHRAPGEGPGHSHRS